MAAEIRETAGIVQPAGLLQLLKHGHKTLRRKARLPGNPEAYAVGLALHVARIVQLALDRGGLRADHRRLYTVAAAGADLRPPAVALRRICAATGGVSTRSAACTAPAAANAAASRPSVHGLCFHCTAQRRALHAPFEII